MIYLHLGEEKHVVQEQVYWVYYAGERKKRSATIYSNLQKRTQSRFVTRIIQARFTMIKQLIQCYL